MADKNSSAPRAIGNDEFRKRVGELATGAAERSDVYEIGTNPKRPSYRLESAVATPAEVLALAIPVRPDQIRKKLNVIRALLRTEDDFCFGIVVGERIVAVLRRHPNLSLDDVHHFRDVRRKLAEQLSAQHEQLTEHYGGLEERLRRIEALVDVRASAKPKKGSHRRSAARKTTRVKTAKAKPAGSST